MLLTILNRVLRVPEYFNPLLEKDGANLFVERSRQIDPSGKIKLSDFEIQPDLENKTRNISRISGIIHSPYNLIFSTATYQEGNINLLIIQTEERALSLPDYNHVCGHVKAILDLESF